MRAITAVLVLAGFGAGCKSAPDTTSPTLLRGEAPHVEIRVDRPIARVGQRVHVKAYGRGELRGGWSCTYQLWRTDESSWQGTGTEPKTQCGDVAESWIWPDGIGREYRFSRPGAHEVCVQVFDRHGWLIGRQMCARVDVPGDNQ